VLIRKGEPELRQAIDAAIADIRADGSYQRISSQYFGADVSK
jgi:cystine transport system substrate-binding protein